MSDVIAVLDACVLYPAPLRDLLMHIAVNEVFQAKWTDQIHDEWVRTILNKRPDLNKKQLARTRKLMNAAILDSVVQDYDHLIATLKLPDPQDHHVLAAAIKVQATHIVTFNLKDFPKKYIQQFNIEAIHPDNFIYSLFQQNPLRVCECIYNARSNLKNPPYTPSQYIKIIAKQSLPKTVTVMQQNVMHI